MRHIALLSPPASSKPSPLPKKIGPHPPTSMNTLEKCPPMESFGAFV